MNIRPVEEYVNVFKVSYPVKGELYNLQILNTNNGDKLVILSETLPISESDNDYLLVTREFLVTKIYDFFFKDKNISPEKITWIEKYHQKSHRGKKNKKSIGQFLKLNWDKESEKFYFLEEKPLDGEAFSKILDDI